MGYQYRSVVCSVTKLFLLTQIWGVWYSAKAPGSCLWSLSCFHTKLPWHYQFPKYFQRLLWCWSSVSAFLTHLLIARHWWPECEGCGAGRSVYEKWMNKEEGRMNRWDPTSSGMMKIFWPCFRNAGGAECKGCRCTPREQLFPPTPLPFLGKVMPLPLLGHSLSIMGERHKKIQELQTAWNSRSLGSKDFR